jgi:hypothetical protein
MKDSELFQQPSGYVFQENFFHLVEKPEFRVEGFPRRTREQFWKKDILPTAILLRQIYIHNYQSEIGEVLKDVWEWLKTDGNRSLIKNATADHPQILSKLPLAVALNRQTAIFFAMENSFKTQVNYASALVAYEPETKDWENDVRRFVYDFNSHSKLTARPYELGKKGVDKIVDGEDRILEKLGGNTDELERWATIDSITWVLLMEYHMGLFRREKLLSELQAFG